MHFITVEQLADFFSQGKLRLLRVCCEHNIDVKIPVCLPIWLGPGEHETSLNGLLLSVRVSLTVDSVLMEARRDFEAVKDCLQAVKPA